MFSAVPCKGRKGRRRKVAERRRKSSGGMDWVEEKWARKEQGSARMGSRRECVAPAGGQMLNAISVQQLAQPLLIPNPQFYLAVNVYSRQSSV